MTQPSPTTTAQSPTTSQPQSTSSIPAFTTLQNAIQTAATGDRTSIYHLFLAIFTSARAAVRCLAEHYKTHHHLLTTETLARLKYCSARLEAIFYTLRHAPERFLTPAQLRAITRARAVLAHIWNQPVTFDPLVPYLTSPAHCPPPPRSAASPSPVSPDASLRAPRSALHSSDAPHAELHTSSSPANPLLLNSPGRALVSVLLQLAALYGLSPATVPAMRSKPSHSTPSAVTSPSEQAPSLFETALHTPHVSSAGFQPASSSPASALHTPHLSLHPPP